VSKLKVLCLLTVLRRISEVDKGEWAEEGMLKVLKETSKSDDERV
jgi:hypothetical protein